MDRRRMLTLTSIALAGASVLPDVVSAQARKAAPGLWGVWDNAFARARFVSLSHVLTPDTPVWSGFPSTTKFQPGTGRLDDKSPYAPFTYEKTGLETSAYTFATDQFGTQLDPPAHWHQCFPAIDELPPTLALRKLAVISIVDKVQADPNYHLTAGDVRAWERMNGTVPAGSVVMVRSDWSKRWPDASRLQPADHKFPGVTLDALKLLHLERRILLHGHEPLDTDSTPTLVAEDWLMNNGYMQAEGVANLDQVPATGALIAIGFPRLKGGTGGFASFTAICPSNWNSGTRPGDVPDAPLPYNDKRLAWNEAKGVRERTAACDKPKGKQSFN
ncbi:MAG TPA: cyclase family protein [Casimicrobiaceae bacterium]|nr:cyclase family protein [Casimicrobiaceae bacterium]